jgi:hypothetical protein
MVVTIKVYEDPGHAWGAVKRKVLFDLGIAGKISTYSYQKGETVYLEEDCDLGVLIGALKAKGNTVVFNEKYTNGRSPIRSYDTFKA